MTRRASLLTVLSLSMLLLTLLAAPAAVRAQDGDNHVGLVIDRGGGDVTKACVAFDEPELTGYEVLQRSELAVDVDQQGGGAAVCRIDGTGCPSDNCFCECAGGDCVYWSYWQLVDGEWRYAIAGASMVRVGDGAVEGWTWGPGSVTEAVPPPEVTFEEICTVAEIATPQPSPTVTAAPPPAAVSQAATAAPLPSPTAPAATSGSTGTTGSYLSLLVIAGVLAGVAALASRRKSKNRTGANNR